MPDNVRAAAAMSAVLLAAVTVVHATLKPAPAALRRHGAIINPAQPYAETPRAGNDQVLSVITTGLRNHDLSSARQLTRTLSNDTTRSQLLEVIAAAEERHLFQQIAAALQSGRFTDARLAALQRDGEVRDAIMDLSDFGEARHALRQGDTKTAASLAKKLRPGVKRALLRTGIAATHAAAYHHRAAQSELHLALHDVSVVAGKYRRQLLVMIARVLLKVEPKRGLVVLDRAVHESDSSAATPPSRSTATSIGIAGDAFYETIREGKARYSFSLVVPQTDARIHDLLLAYHGQLRCEHAAGTV